MWVDWGKWCPHFRCLPTCQISRVHHTAHRWKLYHFDDFLASYMVSVPWFGENIWIDDEHCPYWDVVKSKSGVLPKRIYPTRQIETLRLLRCDAVGRKNAAKLINCKLPSGVFSKLAFLRAGSKHWKLWQQKGSGIVDWKHLLNKHSIGCTYALHQFNSNQIVIDWKRFGLKGWIRLNRKHFQPIWACTFVCTWVLVYF